MLYLLHEEEMLLLLQLQRRISAANRWDDVNQFLETFDSGCNKLWHEARIAARLLLGLPPDSE